MNTPTLPTPLCRWAPGNTFLGRLERGTGAGYLQALKAPRHTTLELLLSCITDDPRWDRQLDTRAEYYASLAREVGLLAAPLAAYLRHVEAQDNDAPVHLTIDTLGAMGQRGDAAALTVLRDYLTWGASWESAFRTLVECGSPEALAGLDQLACDRFPDDDELMRELSDDEPWLTWSRSRPRIADALERNRADRLSIRAQQSPDRFTGLTIAKLFEHASSENAVALHRTLRLKATPKDVGVFAAHLSLDRLWHCRLALQGLGISGGEEAFTYWKRFVEDNRELLRPFRSTLYPMFKTAPAELALETGRAWLNDPNHLLRWLGLQLLQRTATAEDLDLLQSAVHSALADGEYYRLCSIIEALAHVGSPTVWNELAHAFQEVPYSYARGRTAKALAACAPHRFTEELASEALWDCEDYVREIACDFANPEQPGTREKLTALAADPHEDETVRKAASRRLPTIHPQPTG